MPKLRIRVIVISSVIVFVVCILFLFPFILLNLAEEKLGKEFIINDKDSNTAPGDNFYTAISYLNIVKYFPWHSSYAKDLEIDATLHFIGQYKISYDELKYIAQDRAITVLRKQRDEALERAYKSGESIEVINNIEDSFDIDISTVAWKSQVLVEEQDLFCNKWNKFTNWLKQKEVDFDDEICRD